MVVATVELGNNNGSEIVFHMASAGDRLAALLLTQNPSTNTQSWQLVAYEHGIGVKWRAALAAPLRVKALVRGSRRRRGRGHRGRPVRLQIEVRSRWPRERRAG